MKFFLSILTIVAVTACSSTPKETPAATTATPAIEQKAMETTSTDMAAAQEKPMKEEKKAAATTTTTSSGGAFPSITGTEKAAYTCTNKSDTRKISVLTVTEGGCGVVYNKMGEDKTVAMAKVDMNYCDSKATNIKSNLEAAGFNCGGASGSSTDQPAQ